MNIIANIELLPSFHDSHTWTIAIDADSGFANGKTRGCSGQWRLDTSELHSVPDDIRCGAFPDDDYDDMGLDGIVARFEIETDNIARRKEIWCPDASRCGAYAVLVKWCWEGLYAHSESNYRVRLEQLHSYFPGWGINARETVNGLRLFGMFSSSDKDQLIVMFNTAAEIREPVIDMANFENTGTLLYPEFKRFFDRVPASQWLVNSIAQQHMLAAGIPATSMSLVTTEDSK